MNDRVLHFPISKFLRLLLSLSLCLFLSLCFCLAPAAGKKTRRKNGGNRLAVILSRWSSNPLLGGNGRTFRALPVNDGGGPSKCHRAPADTLKRLLRNSPVGRYFTARCSDDRHYGARGNDRSERNHTIETVNIRVFLYIIYIYTRINTEDFSRLRNSITFIFFF